MTFLGVPPGPLVGEALDFLLEARLDEGPIDEADAYERLAAWARDRGIEALTSSAGDEVLDHPVGVVVVVLHRRRLHEVGRRAQRAGRRCRGRGRPWRSARRR